MPLIIETLIILPKSLFFMVGIIYSINIRSPPSLRLVVSVLCPEQKTPNAAHN